MTIQQYNNLTIQKALVQQDNAFLQLEEKNQRKQQTTSLQLININNIT